MPAEKPTLSSLFFLHYLSANNKFTYLLINLLLSKEIYWFILSLCVHMCFGVYMACVYQRTTYNSWFSSTVWDVGINLGLLSFSAGPFNSWTMSMALSVFWIHKSYRSRVKSKSQNYFFDYSECRRSLMVVTQCEQHHREDGSVETLMTYSSDCFMISLH